MKSLANTSSMAIAEKLRSKAFLIHAFDQTPHSCFSLRCWNNKVAGNLPFLTVAPKKTVLPVLASTTKVDLETEDLPAAKQEEELKIVQVKFQLQRKCKFGEQFCVVGDDPMFGSWNPADAKPMVWSEGNIWTTEMDIAAGKRIQFKFILKGRKGNIMWQPGPDRIIKTWESVNGITVCEDWENAELQKIIEEQEEEQEQEEPEEEEEKQLQPQEQNSNEEPQMMEKPVMSSSSKSTTSRKKVRKITTLKNQGSADNRPTSTGPVAVSEEQSKSGEEN